MQKTRGFFARVLIDLDLLRKLPNQILIEKSGYAFITDIEYERLPLFCSHWRMIGHKSSATNQLNHVSQKTKPSAENKGMDQVYVP